MSSGPTNLYDLCVALRQAIVDGFAADGVALPDRREIVGVNVVGECEKLTIEWDRIFVGIAGAAETPQPVTRALTRVTTINVYLFRCIWTPEGEAMEVLESPPTGVLDAEAKLIMTDAYELHRAITRGHFNGDFEGFCSGLSLGPALKIPTAGGIGGTTMALTAELS